MKKKYLVIESLKNEFFKDKDKVIEDYLAKCCEGGTQILTYTTGKKVVVSLGDKKAYSRNGFFYSVIIKDDIYINDLNEEEYIGKLNDYYKEKFEPIEEEFEEEVEGE